MASDQKRRVLIAVTEQGPVTRIWQAMRQSLGDAGDADIVALFVADDRWERAARLPSSREILLISGTTRNFTPRRAQEIVQESARAVRSELEDLAAESGFRVTFEIVPTSDQGRMKQLVSETGNVVIAPSELVGSPMHAEFERLSCKIVLIEPA